MWFIIRAAFCVGVVFSMVPGAQTSGVPALALSGALAVPAMSDVVDGALSICKSDPKLCFEVAQRLAGIEGGDISQAAAAATAPRSPEIATDTLTAADRSAAPWHGTVKEPRQAPRPRALPRVASQ
jgi:hypothetical protein